MLTSSPKFNGEPTPKALASGLASLGRYGDEYMIHAAEGETMIPAEVFTANPALRDALFQQMEMMGIKDPNRFVVGNAMNSINPITGQPEFFFKKFFKSIKKVFKDVAPVLAPIIGNMIAPGIGGVIASGLVTKLQGGSWRDVATSAAFNLATQGVTSGAKAMGPGGKGFMSGFGEGVSAPFQAGYNLFNPEAANPFNQGIFGNAGVYETGLNARGQEASWYDYALPSYNPNAQFAADLPAGIAAAGGTTATSPQGEINQIVDGRVVPSGSEQANFDRLNQGGDDFLMSVDVKDAPGLATLKRYSNLGPTSLLERGELGPRLTFDSKTGTFVNAPVSEYPQNEIITVGGEQFQNVPKADTIGIDPKTGIPTVSDLGTSGFKPYNDPGALDFGLTGMAEEGLAPILGSETAKTVASYTPYATTAAVVGAGAAAASAAGWFEEEDIPDEKEDPLRFDDYDKWRGMEDKNSPAAIALYRKWYGQPYVTRSDYEAQIGGPDTSKPDWWFIPEGAAAQTREGFGAVPSIPGQQASIGSILGQQAGIGSVLSQRAQPIQLTANRGGEVMGPGTGTSDSIPARLSDGEFVMTANAVRNAGNGNRDVGAARMYDMMRRFEGGTA
jgi:hypothetical protein